MSKSEERASRRRRGGFLLGAALGAVAGILLAPRSGKETRAQLMGATESVGGQMDRVKGALEAGKDQAADQSEALRRKIEETRTRLRHQMETREDDHSAPDTAGPCSDESDLI